MGSIEAGLLSSWLLHSVFSRSVMFVQLALISSVAIGSQVQFPELQVYRGMDHGFDVSLLNTEL